MLTGFARVTESLAFRLPLHPAESGVVRGLAVTDVAGTQSPGLEVTPGVALRDELSAAGSAKSGSSHRTALEAGDQMGTGPGSVLELRNRVAPARA
jgi:hypothetical protein